MIKHTLPLLLLATALLVGCEKERRYQDMSRKQNPTYLYRTAPTDVRPAGMQVFKCTDDKGETFICDDNFIELFDSER